MGLIDTKPTAAAYRVTVDGKDVTSVWKRERRVLEIEVNDLEGEASDSCTIVLDDRAPHIAWPPKGATLQLWLGNTVDDLTDMGPYTLDAPHASSPPARLRVTGHAATFLGGDKLPMQTHRTRTWAAVSIADMAATIALEHGLISRVQPTLAGEILDPVEQVDESDLAFFTRLMREYGARVRVKGATGPKSALEVVGAGSQLPKVVLSPRDVDAWDAPLGDRSKAGSVVANYRNPKSGEAGTSKAGSGEPRIVLPNTYKTAKSALHAAKARLKDGDREAGQISLELTALNTQIASGTAIALSGFRSEIDTVWNVVQATHRANTRPRTHLTAERAA